MAGDNRLSNKLNKIIPEINKTTVYLLLKDSLLELRKNAPTIIFVAAQKTFITGEDRPVPGGFANGVGKASPFTPCIKCKREFVRNTPENKQAG
ncbi:MAG: hypothetical protein JWQ63_782 [Mucilaginibacter sp.]|jgi:hypothetical protein|nr:hypothetical protein [Mucilaginibacter sp.]